MTAARRRQSRTRIRQRILPVFPGGQAGGGGGRQQNGDHEARPVPSRGRHLVAALSQGVHRVDSRRVPGGNCCGREARDRANCHGHAEHDRIGRHRCRHLGDAVEVADQPADRCRDAARHDEAGGQADDRSDDREVRDFRQETGRRSRARVAPSARRMPISVRRWVTAVANEL